MIGYIDFISFFHIEYNYTKLYEYVVYMYMLCVVYSTHIDWVKPFIITPSITFIYGNEFKEFIDGGI